ncbi:hypothetical protein [Neptunicella marina]|uniref:Uncharacterized protein n=1 Tax=Neptunicella marina TaxID=2125989 RepID=A0A8J6IXZ4_9ALTE|nr:hypothetical protein [Neptunicella marina]MBC3767248.1 hypothetical protein [Neptunicella marina]
MRYKRHQSRPYSIKKNGIKDENIDRQILAIHRAMATKLLKHPHLIEQVRETLEDRKVTGRLPYGHHLIWHSILDHIDQPETFITSITEDSPRMRKLRRNTPPVGILNEQERQLALEQNALGQLDSIDTLIY